MRRERWRNRLGRLRWYTYTDTEYIDSCQNIFDRSCSKLSFYLDFYFHLLSSIRPLVTYLIMASFIFWCLNYLTLCLHILGLVEIRWVNLQIRSTVITLERNQIRTEFSQFRFWLVRSLIPTANLANIR